MDSSFSDVGGSDGKSVVGRVVSKPSSSVDSEGCSVVVGSSGNSEEGSGGVYVGGSVGVEADVWSVVDSSSVVGIEEVSEGACVVGVEGNSEDSVGGLVGNADDG